MKKKTRECTPLVLQRLTLEISQRESATTGGHLLICPCDDMTFRDFTDAIMIMCSELSKNQEKRFYHRSPNQSKKKFCILPQDVSSAEEEGGGAEGKGVCEWRDTLEGEYQKVRFFSAL
jgi:hypothetical protein